MPSHEHYMAESLSLAAQGAGWVAPNPLVGAVIVHRDEIIGRGFHEMFGGPHAEVNAVRSVSDATLLKESTLYVSLEPCCHFGKTPPCADLIIEKKIPRVVVGITDIFAKVSGGGIRKLREAGVTVVENVLSERCFEVNRRFFTFHALQRPYVVLKWAETADRFIARPDGTSKWISGETARTEAHRWRAEEAGILVGTRTARLDDPALTVRHVTGKNPIRIVLDRNLILPPTLKLFDHSTPTIVLNSSREGEERNVSFIKLTPEMTSHEILTALHARGVLSVLIEGGSALLRGFIESDLWDEARIVQNPALKFGAGIAAPHITLPPLRRSVLGEDTVSLVLNHWSAEVQARCLHTSA